MRDEADIRIAMEQYADMIKRICLCHLKNATDTEDVFQNVFMKYMLHEGIFENKEHEKAWFIRVAINACKDHLKILFRHPTVPLDTLLREEHMEMEDGQKNVLQEVLALPNKYKDVIYLFYYEEYSQKK